MPGKKITVVCSVCMESLVRYSCSVNRVIANNGHYLCKTCSMIFRNKKNAKKLWSTRIHKRRGRVQIKVRDGWIDLHVYIVERFLGRKIAIGECVHHCDTDKTNNKIWNLELMTHGAHTTLHNKKRIYKKRKK